MYHFRSITWGKMGTSSLILIFILKKKRGNNSRSCKKKLQSRASIASAPPLPPLSGPPPPTTTYFLLSCQQNNERQQVHVHRKCPDKTQLRGHKDQYDLGGSLVKSRLVDSPKPTHRPGTNAPEPCTPLFGKLYASRPSPVLITASSYPPHRCC